MLNLGRIRLLVAALRSDLYEQGHNYLCILDPEGKKMCCLGVATDIAMKFGVGLDYDEMQTHLGRVARYGDAIEYLPNEVMEFYGFDHMNPTLKLEDGSRQSATNCNDELKLTLPQIGDAFERTFLQNPS